ncbi:MAG: hypothetical protein LBU89_04700 [Fibromonadaceae bacterium]|jgi:hypothetical protein|nr:hypothetical protein [Fibromonadaceae bacterium]
MYPFFFAIFFLIALAFASDADKRAELLGPVQVSRVHSMDEVKGSYKSPKRAMFMSLVVPGSGQFYVGGQSRHIRGTFYLAEEIALLAGLYYHSMYRYDKQVKKYRNFANDNFDIVKYETGMNNVRLDIYNAPDEFERFYGGTERESYCKALYGPNINTEKCSPFDGPAFYNQNQRPYHNPAEFYRVIANNNFVLGWNDAELNSEAINRINSGNYETILGESESRKKYIAMRKRANDLADRQAIFLGAIILNHIVSAVDAALSAKTHNNNLYEEKVSFLDKIRLGSDIHIGENFKAGAGLWYYF